MGFGERSGGEVDGGVLVMRVDGDHLSVTRRRKR